MSLPLYQVETNILPISTLLQVFSGLAFTLLICFIDQNSIGLALPKIGQDLNCASTIAWAGTSALIANTVFQVLYGRLSDIFGRKIVFLVSVGLLAGGDLLCSFAHTGPELYIFRAIAGIGGGGVTALSMMIVSDVVTLENRGKYQGILGSCVGLGNMIGPFMAAGFIEHNTWRAIFWCISPLAALSGVVVGVILPPNKVTGDLKSKARAIDYFGVATSSIAIVLLLIPISGAGTYFVWSSPLVVSMLVSGSLLAILFVIVEWKVAPFPMMPLRIFHNRAVAAILIQNFLFGIVYYSHLYYLPIFYQNALQYSPITAAALTIPFVAGQSCFSILSGQYISRFKRYGEVIWFGFTIWTLGTALVAGLFTQGISNWKAALILFLEGAGVGNVFQPTLVAAQAHSEKHDRAVVIGVRNFLRSLGGAIGLAMSSAIYSNVLTNAVTSPSTNLPFGFAAQILDSILYVPNLDSLTAEQKNVVLDSYMASSHVVFIMWVPMMGVCLLLCSLIKDKGLKRPGEDEEKEGKRAAENRSADASDQNLTIKSDLELGNLTVEQPKILDQEIMVVQQQKQYMES
ncbi:hypothetical protein B7463_g11667, partial [Scytalidium lignicola]